MEDSTSFQVLVEVKQLSAESGPFKVEAHFSGVINVSPVVARRRATGFLGMEVGMMLLADEPTLVIVDQKPVWRVPATLNLPGVGKVAVVGAIEVDAQSGEVIRLSAEQIKEMQDHANAIAARFTPSTARAG